MIEITIRLRYDYDVSRAPASIRRDSTRAKNNMSIFRRSRVVVVSQSNRNCDTVALFVLSAVINRHAYGALCVLIAAVASQASAVVTSVRSP